MRWDHQKPPAQDTADRRPLVSVEAFPRRRHRHRRRRRRRRKNVPWAEKIKPIEVCSPPWLTFASQPGTSLIKLVVSVNYCCKRNHHCTNPWKSFWVFFQTQWALAKAPAQSSSSHLNYFTRRSTVKDSACSFIEFAPDGLKNSLLKKVDQKKFLPL